MALDDDLRAAERALRQSPSEENWIRYARILVRTGRKTELADLVRQAGATAPGAGVRELLDDLDEALRKYPAGRGHRTRADLVNSFLRSRGWRFTERDMAELWGTRELYPADTLEGFYYRVARERKLRDLPSARGRRQMLRRVRRWIPKSMARRIRGRGIRVAGFLGVLALVAAIILFGAPEAGAGEIVVDCDCASIEFGILTDAVQDICYDREAQLQERVQNGTLAVDVDSSGLIRGGDVCDEDAQGELAFPRVGERCPTEAPFCKFPESQLGSS